MRGRLKKLEATEGLAIATGVYEPVSEVREVQKPKPETRDQRLLYTAPRDGWIGGAGRSFERG